MNSAKPVFWKIVVSPKHGFFTRLVVQSGTHVPKRNEGWQLVNKTEKEDTRINFTILT